MNPSSNNDLNTLRRKWEESDAPIHRVAGELAILLGFYEKSEKQLSLNFKTSEARLNGCMKDYLKAKDELDKMSHQIYELKNKVLTAKNCCDDDDDECEED